ncbi:MAG: superoxide dismutase [Waddliaceae bacterium]|nr:superoxide dismutase [Waddliaceae bacterium]
MTLVSLLFGACAQKSSPCAAYPQVEKATTVLSPTRGNNVFGTVTFTQVDDGVLVEADIHGLEPGNHGFHVHHLGDIDSSDGTATKGHFNPHSMDHGGPFSEVRHAGDLGNITADSSGYARYHRIDKWLSLNGPASIVGRSVIVHAANDDLHSQPTGAAGARVAQGVIGVSGIAND